MRTALPVLLLLSLGVLLAARANAQPAAAPPARTLVYVDDVTAADPALAPDATALTSTLCAALAKDRRLDVMCAPDVRQILAFAATAAMVGTGSGPTGPMMERLNKTQLMVSGVFRKEGAGFVFVVKGGKKSDSSTPEVMEIDRALVALEQRAGVQRALLDALPALAARIADGLLKPAAPPSTPAPPPAPLGG
ncbi:MAG: hypothetical protein IT383_13710 [Deltaproteobacteria bacterium]|nr:hypothetical protein [Deltaproteobacteria bacterium]